MNLYLGAGGNHNIFLRKSDGGLDIYSNFSKIVIEGISNARCVSDCFNINCDSSGKNMVRIILRYYFLYSSTLMF